MSWCYGGDTGVPCVTILYLHGGEEKSRWCGVTPNVAVNNTMLGCLSSRSLPLE